MASLVYWALWIIFTFVFGFLHELGHAAMSRVFFKDRAWIITIGSGVPVLTTKRLIINTWFFAAGKINYSVKEGKKSHHIARAAGGFIVNIILAILIFLFAMQYSSHVYELPFWWPALPIALFVNILYAIATLIPVTYPYGVVKGMPSDGLQILRLIKNRSKQTNAQKRN